MKDFELSLFGEKSLIPSPVNSMTASFSKTFRKGVDINLGVGYVNDDTIPHQELAECMRYVLDHTDEFKNALNYGSADGSENLKRAIRRYYLDNKIGGLTSEVLGKKNICIGANGATSLLEAIADILPTGIVITAEPNYYIYTETLERKGFTICPIPEDEQGLDTDYLRRKLSTIDIEKISFFYIISINNPTSVVLSNDRRKEIVEIATTLSEKRGRKIPVVFDKAYEDILFDKNIPNPQSGMLFDTLGLVHEVGTFSKVIAPALRIGYLIGEPSDLLTAIVQKTSDIGFSAPLINEEMAAHFLNTCIDSHAQRVQQGYAQKAKILGAKIQELLGDYLENVSGGQAGFYFYLTFKEIETHRESLFFRYLMRETGNQEVDGVPEKYTRLVYVPGEFCVMKNGPLATKGRRQLRIAYGFEEPNVLVRAVELMAEAAAYVMKNKK